MILGQILPPPPERAENHVVAVSRNSELILGIPLEGMTVSTNYRLDLAEFYLQNHFP